MTIFVAAPLRSLWIEQQHGTCWWIVRQDYYIGLVTDENLFTLHIPAGFRYDRSSIPRWISWLISKDDLGCHAPLVHDALYQRYGVPASVDYRDYPSVAMVAPGDYVPWCKPWRTFTKAETDEAFYRVMIENKVSSTKAWWAWKAVSWFARRW